MTLAVSTLGELKSAVAQYLDRSDLTDKIPLFIQLGERRLFRKLRTPANEKTFVATSVGGTFAIPADYVATKFLMVNDWPLERISDIRARQKLFQSVAGVPLEFTTIGNDFVLVPAPDGDYDAELHYYADLSGELVADSDSSNILLACTDLYIYAACLEAAPFLKNDPRLETWKGLFDAGIADVNAQVDDGEYSGSGLAVTAQGVF